MKFKINFYNCKIKLISINFDYALIYNFLNFNYGEMFIFMLKEIPNQLNIQNKMFKIIIF